MISPPRRIHDSFGCPRWLVRQYVQSYVLSCLLSPFKNAKWMEHYLHAAICRGMMHECKAHGGKVVLAQRTTTA